MLTRPGWLTYSGRFTHISGHPSAAVQVEHRIGKVRRSKTNVLPLCRAAKPDCVNKKVWPQWQSDTSLSLSRPVSFTFFDQLLMTLVTSPLERCTVFRVRVNVKHGTDRQTDRQTDSVTRNAAY